MNNIRKSVSQAPKCEHRNKTWAARLQKSTRSRNRDGNYQRTRNAILSAPTRGHYNEHVSEDCSKFTLRISPHHAHRRNARKSFNTSQKPPSNLVMESPVSTKTNHDTSRLDGNKTIVRGAPPLALIPAEDCAKHPKEGCSSTDELQLPHVNERRICQKTEPVAPSRVAWTMSVRMCATHTEKARPKTECRTRS